MSHPAFPSQGMAGRLLLSVLLAGLLIALPACAAGTTVFFSGWTWDETKEPVDITPDELTAGNTAALAPLVVPNPPYSTDNPDNRGTYNGPCPIGGSAPQLRTTGLSTGAQCRGACGIDCPTERCIAIADQIIPVEGGTCTYSNLIMCDSHAGCRNHDACYDYCSEKLKETSLVFGPCHGVCNQRCYDEYGYTNCVLWAALPGSASSTLGGAADAVSAPLTDKYLIFSDAPIFAPTTTTPACDSANPYDCWQGTWDSSATATETAGTTSPGSPQQDGWEIGYDINGRLSYANLWENGEKTDICVYEPEDDDWLCTSLPDSTTYRRETLSRP